MAMDNRALRSTFVIALQHRGSCVAVGNSSSAGCVDASRLARFLPIEVLTLALSASISTPSCLTSQRGRDLRCWPCKSVPDLKTCRHFLVSVNLPTRGVEVVRCRFFSCMRRTLIKRAPRSGVRWNDQGQRMRSNAELWGTTEGNQGVSPAVAGAITPVGQLDVQSALRGHAAVCHWNGTSPTAAKQPAASLPQKTPCASQRLDRSGSGLAPKSLAWSGVPTHACTGKRTANSSSMRRSRHRSAPGFACLPICYTIAVDCLTASDIFETAETCC